MTRDSVMTLFAASAAEIGRANNHKIVQSAGRYRQTSDAKEPATAKTINERARDFWSSSNKR